MNSESEPATGRVAQFVWGLPFLLIGGYLVLAGLGVVPIRALVQLWIIVCAGLIFLIPGAVLIFSALISGSRAGSVLAGTRVICAEEGRASVAGLWGFALFSSILVTMFWGLILTDAPSSGNMPDWMAVAIIGLFTLVAVATIGVAIYRTLGALRYGEAKLVLSSRAVHVGGRLHGYVEFPRGDLPIRVTAKFQCLRYGVENSAGTGDAGAAIRGLLKSFWDESREVAVADVAGRSRMDINFPIPEGLPASYLPVESGRGWVMPGRAYCQWMLRVSADVPGVDLARTFIVEVLAEETAGPALAPEPESGSEPDRAAAAARVALAELTAGRTPAAVAGRLEGFGVSDAVINQVFNDIGGDESTPFAPTVRAYLVNLARIQAEVDSGQLILLQRARGPAQPKRAAASVRPGIAPPNPGATIGGAPVLLADESVLCRGKWIAGGFLLVWGGLFGGIPVVISIADATHRSGGLFLFFLIGCAAFCGGLWLIGRRHTIWLLPDQGRIVEKTGVFRADQCQYHARAAFDRVIVAKSISRSSKGHTSITFHVALAKSDAGQKDSLGLGDFSEFDAARAAAVVVAGRMSLPVFDLSTDSEPRPIQVAATAVEKFAAASADAGWWRQPSAIALILANLVPIGGVLFAQWEIFPIMLLFWLENLIVGVFTALKILACRKGHVGEKLFTLPFFVVHYGMFCSGHGIFVMSLFAPGESAAPGMDGLLPDTAAIFHVVQQQGLWIAVVALFASHGFSFVVNFLGRGEYQLVEVGKVMMAPYARIIVLHVVIMLGGFAVMAMESPLFALLLLVILKIVMDVHAHLREHRHRTRSTLAAEMSGMAANP